MRPYRRAVLHPTYGCVAITARGLRCGHDHYTEIPVIFDWDPVAGRGVCGPNITLCRMHDYLWLLEAGERVEVVGGWMGRAWNPAANVWTVMTTVYETRDGKFASKHWWELRRETRFGDCSRVRYDDAVRAKGQAAA